jgi:antibiotic biosynthesis monooxygenase (ABM) superfamily enzyme
MGWSTLFNPVKLFHLIISAFVIYGLKSWIEVKFNTKDPIRNNKYVSAIFFAGSTLFMAGIAFKVMHWPFSSIMLISGVLIACTSFVFSFFVTETAQTENNEIIDDFKHD